MQSHWKRRKYERKEQIKEKRANKGKKNKKMKGARISWWYLGIGWSKPGRKWPVGKAQKHPNEEFGDGDGPK